MSKKASASWSGSRSLGVTSIRTTRPARKPTHAAYSLVPRLATALPQRLHRPLFSPVHPDPYGLGPVLSPPLHHRVYLHRRPGRHRPLVLFPPLLLPLCLVARRPLSGARPLAHPPLLSARPDPVGRRRYPLPQARLGPVRRRHASRPPPLQQGAEGLLLGPRLGRAGPAAAPAALGRCQGVRSAHRLPPLRQPPGADQGQAEGQRRAAAGRQAGQVAAQPGPPYPARTAGGVAAPRRRLDPRAAVRGLRR